MLFDPPPVSQCSKTFFSHSEEDTSEGAGIILHRQRKVQDSWKSTLDSAIKNLLITTVQLQRHHTGPPNPQLSQWQQQ